MPDSNIRDLIDVIAAALPTPAPGSAAPRNDAISTSDELQASTTATPLQPSSMADEIGRLVAEISVVNATAAATTEPAQDTSTRSRQESGTTAGTIVEDIGKTVLGGLSLVSLFSGLFGSGAATTPEPLPNFELPQAISADLALDNTSGNFTPVTYSALGTPRGATATTQVTVNVSAMDSRSFMDHSSDIARAVREAMLNSHSLNDVIGDL